MSGNRMTKAELREWLEWVQRWLVELRCEHEGAEIERIVAEYGEDE